MYIYIYQNDLSKVPCQSNYMMKKHNSIVESSESAKIKVIPKQWCITGIYIYIYIYIYIN